jgi:adenylate cyclase
MADHGFEMLDPASEASSACRSCGNDLRANARFCDACGTAIAPTVPTGEYKQVTVLFADVVGSMRLAAELPTERLRDIMNELFNRAAAVVQRYQGTVDKFTGDGLMALFGAPVALEDHALRACIAALEIQTATSEFADEIQRRDGVRLQLRIGLNSGKVIAGDIGSGPGRYTAVGHPVGMAQRMESAAPPGAVLCSLSTSKLVDGVARLGPVHDVVIKGVDTPEPARLVLAVQSGVVGRNEGVMVGRDTDLNRLHRIFEAGQGRSIGIVGAAGVGKTRLIGEFSDEVRRLGAHVVMARCDAHTAAVAFRAVARILRAMFEIGDSSDAVARARVLAECDGMLTAADAQIVFDVMGIGDPAAPPAQVSVDGRRRRLVEVMSRAVQTSSRRMLFALEDAHWIDAPSDEVLDEFATSLAGTTSVFVTTFRPEYRGALRTDDTIALQPLSDDMAVRLVCQLVGSDPSVASLVKQIAVAAVGNPFFAEEIVRDLADRQLILGSRGRYRLRGQVGEIAVPATVQAVLSARIDRLPPDAKAVVNAAAVIGTRFDVDTLRSLVPDAMSSALSDLVSAELIDQTEFVPRQRYCFRHPLVRTVAYESQLGTTRAKAHHRLAAAIEARDPDAADENAALIATHWEAAGEIARAYRWHMRAAEWLRPRDLPAARAQWLSARQLSDRLPADVEDTLRARIAPRTMLISTESFVGIDGDGDEQYGELRELARRAGDVRSLAIATAGRIMSFTFNQTRVPEALSLASETETLLKDVDWDAVPEIDIILIAVVRAYHANCEFDAALATVDAIAARPHHEPTIEYPAGIDTFRGVIELYRGHVDNGRRHLHAGVEAAKALSPVSYAIMLSFFSLTVVLGLQEPGYLLGEMQGALQRAESFGDICGIITAQFAYGTSLLRADPDRRDEAIAILRSAKDNIVKHKVMMTNLLPGIAADLALDAAAHGRRDDAIDGLRALLSHHMDSGMRAEIGCVGEALVRLLLERADALDRVEAHHIVDEWQVKRPGVPAADLWWVKSRALLAEAEGDRAAYAELAQQYLRLCERVDARGRLAEARRMIAKGG